jgi:hypothetical protein
MKDSQNLKLRQDRRIFHLLNHRAEIRRFKIEGQDRLFAPRKFQAEVELLDLKTLENGLLVEMQGEEIHPLFRAWYADFCERDDLERVIKYLSILAQRKVDPAHIAIITRMNFDNPMQRKMELRRVLFKMSKSLSRYYPLIFIDDAEFKLHHLDEFGYLFKKIENTRFYLKCRESRYKVWFEEG